MRTLRVPTFILLLLTLGAKPALSQTSPWNGLYQITSGRYVECCGIAGPIPHTLPNASQSFVELTLDAPSGTAQMSFLEQDGQTVFETFPGGFSYTLFGGIVSSNVIRFRAFFPGGVPGQSWEYTVSNSGSGLSINGSTTLPPVGADIINQFRHTNVVAVPLPGATIRVSAVEVCWNSLSSRTYQVQYRSEVTGSAWNNLGQPTPGNGGTQCITDSLPAGQPRRFYRVMVVP